MACELYAAPALWPHLLPPPRRSAAAQDWMHHVPSMNQFPWKIASSGRYFAHKSCQDFRDRMRVVLQPLISHCWSEMLNKHVMSAAKSFRSVSPAGCTSSGPSAKIAVSSRPKKVSTPHSNLSMRHCLDTVPGTYIVISGYWTGPNLDDGCGYVEAMLHRIV